ncbi:DNA translocase FtsK [Fervidibacillus albus]|uniref:DNA translocase FtsK n=2 Tax=Fervidibacillus albus TaxID=2980026 RepID=A0A9E8RXI2_9BACI|nr:DNA translocase FtsK [Fervidibacillus albus]
MNHRSKTSDSLKKPDRKRRFSHTETIPSPIYGYQRKTVKQQPIEFELSPFEIDVQWERDDRTPSDVHPTSTETMNEQAETIDHPIEFVDGKDSFSSEKGEEKDGSNHSVVENVQKIETEDNDPMDEVIGELSETFVDSTTEQSGKLLAEEKQLPVQQEKNTLDVSQKIENLVDRSAEMEQVEADDRNLENQTGESAHSNQSLENAKEKREATNAGDVRPHSETPVKKGKKSVPFNVFMLKSDREKLKNRAEQSVTNKRRERNENSDRPRGEKRYHLPPLHVLNSPVEHLSNTNWIDEQVTVLNETLKSFHVAAKVVSTSEGPSVTRFEISPEMGVKVNKITNLTDDIKLSLAAKDIRIEAPIPGKHTIGIEVPNAKRRPVFLREIIEQKEYVEAFSPLAVAVGLDIAGKPVITDLKKMPHGLIAGATGSGKSVCINTFIISLLYKARPDEVKLLMIDPKMVELAPYNGIPHLISPVITDVKAATQALKWAVEEMERRYELFAEKGVRDIERYNEKESEKMPFIVIIIDELADLMMMAPADVEDAICRIAQKARACGIHLLIATQRPSVDVITGLIKANVPTRIAFSVSSQVDSRTIIDTNGAERLLGKGDMLFLENGTSKPVRLQGPFISDDEIESVVDHVRKEGEPEYLFQQEELIKKSDTADQDELFLEACEFAVQHGSISTSSLQRRFRIGYNRAARLIELMEEKGIITEQRGSKPRDVLITEQDLHQFNE